MDNTKELLGKRIKELRTAKKLTQAKLAETIGIEPRSISRIESGHHFPKSEHLEKFANALGVEIKDLFNFAHLETAINLKFQINSLVNYADERQLSTIYKVVQALLK